MEFGKRIPPDKPREGAAADRKELDGIDRWPVTISYFDPTKATAGEQTPPAQQTAAADQLVAGE